MPMAESLEIGLDFDSGWIAHACMHGPCDGDIPHALHEQRRHVVNCAIYAPYVDAEYVFHSSLKNVAYSYSNVVGHNTEPP